MAKQLKPPQKGEKYKMVSYKMSRKDWRKFVAWRRLYGREKTLQSFFEYALKELEV